MSSAAGSASRWWIPRAAFWWTAATWSSRKRPAASWAELIGPQETIRHKHQDGVPLIVVSVPVYFKESHVAQVIAWCPRTGCCTAPARTGPFSPSPDCSRWWNPAVSWLESGRLDRFPIEEAIEWSGRVDRSVEKVIVAEKGEAVTAAIAIAGTDFTLLSIAPSAGVFAETAPIQHVFGLVAVFGLGLLGWMLGPPIQGAQAQPGRHSPGP